MTAPDDLFGVAFVRPGGKPERANRPGGRKKLPADDVAIAQQLALSLPEDGRLGCSRLGPAPTATSARPRL